MQERGRLLREIGVHILVLGRKDSITTYFISLFGVHAQDFGKGKQS
jgi:hypothetical protein